MGMTRNANTKWFKSPHTGQVPYHEPLEWRVSCDSCGHGAPHEASPGDAADAARKRGFVTVPQGINPSKWHCKGCQK